MTLVYMPLVLNYISTLVTSYELRVGMVFPTNDIFLPDVGLAQSVGGAGMAIDTLQNETILPGADWKVLVMAGECYVPLALHSAISLIREKKVHVIFGPACILSAKAVGMIAANRNTPVFLWGMVTSSVFQDRKTYPTVTSVLGTARDVGLALVSVLKEYEWSTFSILYGDDEASKCQHLTEELETLKIFSLSEFEVSFRERIPVPNEWNIARVLKRASKYARVFLLCFHRDESKRAFLLAAKGLGMDNKEYVFIFYESQNLGFGTRIHGPSHPFYIDTNGLSDGRDKSAFEMAKYTFVLCFEPNESESDPMIREEIFLRAYEWPFNCGAFCDSEYFKEGSTYARYLYDAVILYGHILNKTLEKYGFAALENASLLLENVEGTYMGFSGHLFHMDSHGSRSQIVGLRKIIDWDKEITILNIEINNVEPNLKKLYTNETETVWNFYDGVRPLAIPICGFSDERCAGSNRKRFYLLLITGILFAIILVAAAIAGGIFCHKNRNGDQNLDQNWRIPVEFLQEQFKKVKNPSSTASNKRTNTLRSILNSHKYRLYTFNGSTVIARVYKSIPELSEKEILELRYMVNLENEYLNRFLGLSINGFRTLAIWKFCERGSVKDVISGSVVSMDGFLMTCMIKDIATGLMVLHKSSLHCHGHLTSKDCLVTSNYRVTIGNFGFHAFRKLEERETSDLLWTAPELLQNENSKGTQAGDIYSFAIICSEILTQRSAWNIENCSKQIEELIYLIKSSSTPLLRPDLAMNPKIHVNKALLQLVRDCWKNEPEYRPRIGTVLRLLTAMLEKKPKSPLDYLLLLLEKQAQELEIKVKERSALLAIEKEKTDKVLMNLLPAPVANSLRNGQLVEPEFYDNVTVLLSDIVSFTKLASQCTPMQVTTLLNTLFAAVDNIISKYDIFKVETIGDAYLCVSGLPHRNGNKHAEEIADMAIEAIKCCQTLRIDELPQCNISARIGIHTGPCIAGVVGSTMPRYCIFGETVTITAVMESSGKANLVHTSAATHKILSQGMDGFLFQERGEITLKKIGKMKTYWLLGRKNWIQEELLQPADVTMYQAFRNN